MSPRSDAVPIDKRRYPKDWPAISLAAREAAGQRCQRCGVANGALGARDRFGGWHDWPAYERYVDSDDGRRLWPEGPPKPIRIVLTVHHPDGDTRNRNARLEVLCQKHHLDADRAKHVAVARKTRAKKRLAQIAARGQLALFPGMSS
jgi:hypothetical protein